MSVRLLDEIDRRILEILRENSRVSFISIASELGISEASVRRRVKALIDSGVIRRFTVETSVEIGVQAFVFVSIDPSKLTGEVAGEVLGLRGVRAAYEVTGEYDVVILVQANSIQELNDCIDGIRKIDGVKKTNTVMILRTLQK
ncbi:MAG: Lrp/AsnC family transcriptional regulator [Nitrososphaerota archaeon]|nr:Lrp/AsnC family transcriptional regulator [Candidatus Bathyarchaeota archaeon]MCX8162452.1 Lrp/AsnC family transcriptional regulator [Candidatus Bathyarchaeota archaeon]MDW8061327.1 Lrp/AsnC family transcriptional regulator [Nitrososphaerota archaeon]